MVRSDIILRVRDYLYEGTADTFTDARLNRLFLEELRSLPSKDIYLEEIWTTTTVENQLDYTLPTGTFKVEKLERNDGSASAPAWNDINGYDNYQGAIYLPYLPSTGDTIRVHIKKRFTDIEDDTTALDIPNDISEVLVWGIVVRAYKILTGYLRGDLSWDSVTAPRGISLSSVQSWLRDAKDEYKELVQRHARVPRARDINLVS